VPAKAHQRLIREQRAREGADSGPPVVDIKQAEVRAISAPQARAIIEAHEYLGTMPAVPRFCFGIFFEGRLGGAVVYGDETGESLGVWDRYGYTGRIIALVRGACVHWAHPHAASKLIRRSMALLPRHYTVITATTDADAGERGTIYAACGFDHVGAMSKGGRALIRHDGKTLSGRQARRRFGTEGVHRLRALGVEAVPVPRRARYFAFRGSKAERRRLRSAIKHIVKPYLKHS
jgi:hypothetical protein